MDAFIAAISVGLPWGLVLFFAAVVVGVFGIILVRCWTRHESLKRDLWLILPGVLAALILGAILMAADARGTPAKFFSLLSACLIFVGGLWQMLHAWWAARPREKHASGPAEAVEAEETLTEADAGKYSAAGGWALVLCGGLSGIAAVLVS